MNSPLQVSYHYSHLTGKDIETQGLKHSFVALDLYLEPAGFPFSSHDSMGLSSIFLHFLCSPHQCPWGFAPKVGKK